MKFSFFLFSTNSLYSTLPFFTKSLYSAVSPKYPLSLYTAHHHSPVIWPVPTKKVKAVPRHCFWRNRDRADSTETKIHVFRMNFCSSPLPPKKTISLIDKLLINTFLMIKHIRCWRRQHSIIQHNIPCDALIMLYPFSPVTVSRSSDSFS